jgi:hypothetical protein
MRDVCLKVSIANWYISENISSQTQIYEQHNEYGKGKTVPVLD